MPINGSGYMWVMEWNKEERKGFCRVVYCSSSFPARIYTTVVVWENWNAQSIDSFPVYNKPKEKVHLFFIPCTVINYMHLVRKGPWNVKVLIY